jgi:hypothetical protein
MSHPMLRRVRVPVLLGHGAESPACQGSRVRGPRVSRSGGPCPVVPVGHGSCFRESNGPQPRGAGPCHGVPEGHGSCFRGSDGPQPRGGHALEFPRAMDPVFVGPTVLSPEGGTPWRYWGPWLPISVRGPCLDIPGGRGSHVPEIMRNEVPLLQAADGRANGLQPLCPVRYNARVRLQDSGGQVLDRHAREQRRAREATWTRTAIRPTT